MCSLQDGVRVWISSSLDASVKLLWSHRKKVRRGRSWNQWQQAWAVYSIKVRGLSVVIPGKTGGSTESTTGVHLMIIPLMAYNVSIVLIKSIPWILDPHWRNTGTCMMHTQLTSEDYFDTPVVGPTRRPSRLLAAVLSTSRLRARLECVGVSIRACSQQYAHP